MNPSFGTKESKSQYDSELVSATSATTGNVSGNAVKSVSGLPTADSAPELPMHSHSAAPFLVECVTPSIDVLCQPSLFPKLLHV